MDRSGRVRVDNWTYGGPLTMDALVPYHGKGQRILLGRNPDALGEPALAFDEDSALICEGIAAIERGPYDSREDSRTAARYRKDAAMPEEANAYLDQAEFDAAMAERDLSIPAAPPESAPAKIAGGRFGAPLRDTLAAPLDAVPQEYYRNRDTAPRANRAFESTVNIRREDVSDRLGIFEPMIAGTAQTARLPPEEPLCGLLETGTSALCYDGQAVFDADRPTVDADRRQLRWRHVRHAGSGLVSLRHARAMEHRQAADRAAACRQRQARPVGRARPRGARSHGGCDRIHGSTGTGSTRSTAPAMRMSS